MPGVDNGPAKPRVFLVDDEKLFGRVVKKDLGTERLGGPSRFDLVWDFECPLCGGAGCMTCEDEGRAPFGRYPRLALEHLCGPDPYDLTILDIVMPDMNGMQFYDHLRLRAPARCQRLVFVTGGALIPAVESFLKKHLHLEKPPKITEIEALVDIFTEKKISRGPR